MRIIKPRTFVIMAMLGVSIAALLHTSQSVRRAERQVSVLKASIEREEEKIRVLNAEWVHLNRPDRLERLASEFLDLVPPSLSRYVDAKEDIFPQAQVQDTELEVKEIEKVIEIRPVSAQPKDIEAVKNPVTPARKPAQTMKSRKVQPKPAPKEIEIKTKEKTKDFGALLDELSGDGGRAQ
tara:strand:+ start:3776 stop:4318 length:543 start_codon:yes stop_codon:yes gene_type:complete